MASSPSEDHQNQSKKEAGQSSDTNPSPAPAGHPPPTGYPPAMGYPPPPMGYQPGYPPPPPYPGYNNNGYSQYPYTQPPPAAYYNSNVAYQSQHRSSGPGFARGILAAIVFLVVFTCMSSIITWIVLRPEIPGFHVDTFSVSNFNVSSPKFMASWEANITVDNPNTKLKVYVERIQSFMYYEEDEVLASSFLEPLSLDTKGKAMIHASLTTNGTSNQDQPMVPIWVVEDLRKDRDKGMVSFNLRLAVWSTFKSGSWWTRHVKMRVFCEDLKVAFVGATGNATLVPVSGKARDCDVYV